MSNDIEKEILTEIDEKGFYEIKKLKDRMKEYNEIINGILSSPEYGIIKHGDYLVKESTVNSLVDQLIKGEKAVKDISTPFIGLVLSRMHDRGYTVKAGRVISIKQEVINYVKWKKIVRLEIISKMFEIPKESLPKILEDVVIFDDVAIDKNYLIVVKNKLLEILGKKGVVNYRLVDDMLTDDAVFELLDRRFIVKNGKAYTLKRYIETMVRTYIKLTTILKLGLILDRDITSIISSENYMVIGGYIVNKNFYAKFCERMKKNVEQALKTRVPLPIVLHCAIQNNLPYDLFKKIYLSRADRYESIPADFIPEEYIKRLSKEEGILVVDNKIIPKSVQEESLLRILDRLTKNKVIQIRDILTKVKNKEDYPLAEVLELIRERGYIILGGYIFRDINVALKYIPNSFNKATIAFVGDGAVGGKTSLIMKYLYNKLPEMVTIGVEFFTLKKDDIQLLLIDTAGQVQWRPILEELLVLMQPQLIILSFDLSRPDTFENLKTYWEQFLVGTVGCVVPVILVGNKVDLFKAVPIHAVREYIDGSKLNIVAYIETSVINNINIEEVFNKIIEILKDYHKYIKGNVEVEYILVEE